MKKLLGLVFVMALVAGSWLLVTPPSVEAGCSLCLPGGMTPVKRGTALNSCTQAVNNAISAAYSAIPGSCDTCQTNPVQVAGCQVIGYVCVDGTQGSSCGVPIYAADYMVSYKCSSSVCF